MHSYIVFMYIIGMSSVVLYSIKSMTKRNDDLRTYNKKYYL